MMASLILSLFPGIGMLDHAFVVEGFTVVRGPDPLWGGDVRRFHPPAGRFDGVIGGDPCQSHSALANLVRAKGLEPSFPDLTGEYQRVIEEARPAWFLRENVPQAPDVKPEGYAVRSFLLDNSTLDSGDGWGNEQMRRRRFWFGVRDGECPELRAWMRFALRELPDRHHAIGYKADMGPGMRDARRRRHAGASDARSVPVAMGGSGRRKVTAVGGNDGHVDALGAYAKAKQQSVTDRHHSNELRTTKVRGEGWVGVQPRRDLKEMLRLQGFPPDWIGHQPWTMSAMRKMVGNGVPLSMGRELARAIRCWLEQEVA